MTSFNFLKKDNKFDSFADVSISAERAYNIDLSMCARIA